VDSVVDPKQKGPITVITDFVQKGMAGHVRRVLLTGKERDPSASMNKEIFLPLRGLMQLLKDLRNAGAPADGLQ